MRRGSATLRKTWSIRKKKYGLSADPAKKTFDPALQKEEKPLAHGASGFSRYTVWIVLWCLLRDIAINKDRYWTVNPTNTWFSPVASGLSHLTVIRTHTLLITSFPVLRGIIDDNKLCVKDIFCPLSCGVEAQLRVKAGRPLTYVACACSTPKK